MVLFGEGNDGRHSYPAAQVSRYVEREILNHRRLIHPHIVEMREV